MRYALRTLLEVVTVAAFILALVVAWRTRPPAAPPPPASGRFQVLMSDGDTIVMDTAIGELWSRPKGYSQFQRTESPWNNDRPAPTH